MKENVILLLDTYFQVLTWQGVHIRKWQELGYHEKEEYESLRDLLKSPKEDVAVSSNSFLIALLYPLSPRELYSLVALDLDTLVVLILTNPFPRDFHSL